LHVTHMSTQQLPPQASLQKGQGLRTLSALKAVSFLGQFDHLDQTKSSAPARSIKSAYSGSGEHDAPKPVRLPGKGEKPNAKVTDTSTNGVVPARSRPYYVDNENGGDSVEAHVDRAVVAARTTMVGTVECLLLRVNKETLPRLHSGKYRPVHHQASERVPFSGFLLNLFFRL